MIYKWKEAWRINADPQRVGEEIEKVQASVDALTPATIVAAASKPKSVLHSLFTWDDTEAARKHRENEARYILRMLVVSVDIPDREEPVLTRAFVRIQTKDADDKQASSYTAIMDALDDDELRAQITGKVVDQIRQARGVLRQYEFLTEAFTNAQMHLDSVIDELQAA